MAKPQMSEEELERRWKAFNEFRKNDKRTPNELFASLCTRLRKMAIDSGKPMPSDQEVEQGVRNLIGLCETLMKIGDKKHK